MDGGRPASPTSLRQETAMFEFISAAPPDPILGLTEAFKNDQRDGKVNLTIGVYRNEEGDTPILDCVKKAEQRLVTDEATKGYLGIDGLQRYKELVTELVLGEIVPADRVCTTQTPGGTGALKVAADFLATNFRGARIWLSTPTWPNHPAIFEKAGLATESFPYLAADKTSLDFDRLIETLERDGKPGDTICLHACCHNPTGIDPTSEQWSDIAELTAQRGMLPLIDFAYHGFGDGLEEDRVGLKAIAKQHEEFLVCSSYSKNFGLYSQRTGALLAVSAATKSTDAVSSRIKQVVRSNYSNPPRHGGAIVATVLGDGQLRKDWETELTEMRQRIHHVRELFVEAMGQTDCGVDFSFLLKQRGMFSFSGLSPMQVDWLRSEKGIYIVGSGRINVAGISQANLGSLTSSIAEAIKQ